MTPTTIRAYRPDDLQAIADIYNAVDDAIGVERGMNPFIFQSIIEEAGDPARNAFVVESAGRVIGFGGFTFFPASGNAWARGVVHPDYWGQGIGTQLLQRTEARIQERAGAEMPAGTPLTVDRYLNAANPQSVRLCEAQGYLHVRDSYEMRIEFDVSPVEMDASVEAPPLPAGFTLRPFAPEHAQALYDADSEAFAQNRDNVEMSFEEWSNVLMNPSDVDTSLWQIAYAGDEIAGYVMSRRDDPQGRAMYISVFGVRPAFRRRGLGEALLRHSFAVFRAKGALQTYLHVDSSNRTNAVELYERAGMHVHSHIRVYRKTLRPETGS